MGRSQTGADYAATAGFVIFRVDDKQDRRTRTERAADRLPALFIGVGVKAGKIVGVIEYASPTQTRPFAY